MLLTPRTVGSQSMSRRVRAVGVIVAPTTLAAAADVSVTTTAAPETVQVGDTVGYDITVANAGPSDAAAVTLSDPLPAGTTFVSATQVSGPASPARRRPSARAERCSARSRHSQPAHPPSSI